MSASVPVSVALDQQAEIVRLKAQNKALRACLEQIALDCESVARVEIVDAAEKRAWLSVAHRARNYAAQ